MLDKQVVKFGDNLTWCLQAVKPLATVLQPPLKEPNLEDIRELVKLFPSKMSVDSVVLQAEFHNFVSYVDLTKTQLESLAEATKFLEVCKSAFPLTNRAFRLRITSFVTVAQDEKTVSRFRVVITYLRTTMTDARLESLMLLFCKKDLTDAINKDTISTRWVELKSLIPVKVVFKLAKIMKVIVDLHLST